MKLEDLQANTAVRGVLPEGLATVVGVQWFGSEALELTYKSPAGKVANHLLYRHDEPQLEIVEVGRPWSFDGDGALFRLVSEAQRIRLAHLFDPVLAVHTSVVEPLPYQITAVYESMLTRQPLRFLLADDPGAGKTIMTRLPQQTCRRGAVVQRFGAELAGNRSLGARRTSTRRRATFAVCYRECQTRTAANAAMSVSEMTVVRSWRVEPCRPTWDADNGAHSLRTRPK